MAMKKRAQGFALDAIVMLLVVVAFVWVAMSIAPAFDEITTDLQEDPAFNNSTTAGQMLEDNSSRYPELMDNLALTILVFLAIALVVSVFLIDSHPIFFIFFILIFIFVAVIAADLSNTFDTTFDDTEFANVKDDFPLSTFIFNNLLQVIIGYFVLGGIALYAKVQLR